ncbi:MAG: alpha/beta hydrolase [Myxococcota bacterium]
MPSSNDGYVSAETRTVSVEGTDFAYRMTGDPSGVPVILLNHLAGVLDDWDPRVVDCIAAKHWLITFDNRGIGSSGGATPETVKEMAEDAIAFIRALGFTEVDIFGFSLGGCVAQEVVLKAPELVRKLILAGTGPAGAVGAEKIPAMAYRNQLRSLLTFTDVRTYLFFTRTRNGREQAKAFLKSVSQRTVDKDKSISLTSFRSQLKAIRTFALRDDPDLSGIQQPVLVANGESDSMVPSVNSAHLALGIPNAKLVLYKDAGHGGIFQWHAEFVEEALKFLGD